MKRNPLLRGRLAGLLLVLPIIGFSTAAFAASMPVTTVITPAATNVCNASVGIYEVTNSSGLTTSVVGSGGFVCSKAVLSDHTEVQVQRYSASSGEWVVADSTSFNASGVSSGTSSPVIITNPVGLDEYRTFTESEIYTGQTTPTIVKAYSGIVIPTV